MENTTDMNVRIIKQGLDELASKDPDLKTGLDLVGYPEPRIRPQGFESLLAIILGQQISTEAASSIRKRLDEVWTEKTCQSFLGLNDETLRRVGFSRRKIEYSKGIAQSIADGTLDIAQLSGMSDKDVVEQLVKLRGIGVWSAEIYSMFSLGRLDIFPADDLALQESLRILKGLKERPSAQQCRELTRHWSPWRSIGALFLWKYYRGAPDERGDSEE